MKIPKGWHLERTVDSQLLSGRIYTYKKRGGIRFSYSTIDVEFKLGIPVHDFAIVQDMTHHVAVSIGHKAISEEEAQPFIDEWGADKRYKLPMQTHYSVQFVITLKKEENEASKTENS